MTHRTKAAVLFLLFLICGVGFVVTQRLREQLPAPAPHELFAIVNEQLSAVRLSDFRGAYRYAAAGVQQRFTLPQFEKMIRRRYPEMPRGSRVEYGQVKVRGSSAAVQVFVLDADGSVRSFLFSLTREDESWKVDGLEESPDSRALDHFGGTHA
ncbi:MAG: DUF4864 domain-containing protein [Chthoniobacterales bacterium]